MSRVFVVVEGIDREDFSYGDHHDDARKLSDNTFTFLREDLNVSPDAVITVVDGNTHEDLNDAYGGES